MTDDSTTITDELSPSSSPPNDKTGDDDVRELSRIAGALVPQLFSASKTILLHAFENRATQNSLSALLKSLARLVEHDGRATIRVSTDLLMVNDVRVVVDSQSMGPVLHVVEAMKRRKVEEIEFDPGVPIDQLGRFLAIFFGDCDDEEDVFGALKQAMAEQGVERVSVVEWIERPKRLRDSAIGKREIREESNKAYGRAVLFTGEVLRAVEQQRAIPMPKALRLTQQIVDIVQVDESILLGLASIKDYDEYTFAHSANVAVLSMLIADRLWMPKGDVAGVGVSAILHDIGKTRVPHEILNKEGTLSEQEWDVMKLHTVFGALELARAKAMRSVLDSMSVALQHHVRYNGEGYPRRDAGWDLLTISRIVTVADYFDAMTTPRVYKKEPMTPDKALRFILDNSGKIFDPLIAKVFIQAMGLYPVGTMVVFDTGERALVLKQNPKSRFLHRPVASLIPSGETVDVAETAADGSYQRTILHAIYDAGVEAEKVGRFLIS